MIGPAVLKANLSRSLPLILTFSVVRSKDYANMFLFLLFHNKASEYFSRVFWKLSNETNCYLKLFFHVAKSTQQKWFQIFHVKNKFTWN